MSVGVRGRDVLSEIGDDPGVPPNGVQEISRAQAARTVGRPPAPAAQPWTLWPLEERAGFGGGLKNAGRNGP